MSKMRNLVLAGTFGVAAMMGFASAGNAQEDIDAIVAAADAAAGQAVSFQCIGCHSFGEGEGTRVGPGLYGVVGRVIGGVEGFPYSEALAAKAAAGETWTLAMLDAFFTNPQEAIPGNSMPYAGMANETDRHNLLAYLATLGAQ